MGHDFYDIFYSLWQPPENIKNYTITIEEKPLPQLGTQIAIRVNDSYVFQNFLQPRYELIEEYAQYGIQMVYSFLYNYQEIQQSLESEDLEGSGIY